MIVKHVEEPWFYRLKTQMDICKSYDKMIDDLQRAISAAEQHRILQRDKMDRIAKMYMEEQVINKDMLPADNVQYAFNDEERTFTVNVIEPEEEEEENAGIGGNVAWQH